MHVRRMGAATAAAALAVFQASACANGGNADDGAFDAAGDHVAHDAPPSLYDAGYPPDAPVSFYDAPVGQLDTGAPEAPNGVDTGAPGPEAGGAEASIPETGGQDAVAATGLTVLYSVGDASSTSAYIGCTLSVSNGGSTPVDVSSLELRYYYTAEDTAGAKPTPQMTIQWSHVSTSSADQPLSVTSAFNSYSPSTSTADAYVAFDLSSGHSTLAPGEAAVFSWQMQGPNPATDVYDQTKDYSFSASMSALTPWSHVTLYQSGALAWGTPP